MSRAPHPVDRAAALRCLVATVILTAASVVLLVAHSGSDRRAEVARAAHQPSVITVGLRGSLP